MIKLKKLIAIAVLVSMLPRTVMAQGEDARTSKSQNGSTTEPAWYKPLSWPRDSDEESHWSTDSAFDSDSEADSDSAWDSESDSDSARNSDPKTYSKSRSDLAWDSDSEAGSEAGSDSARNSGPKADSKTRSDLAWDSGSEADSEADSDLDSDLDSGSDHKKSKFTEDLVCTEMTDTEKNSGIEAKEDSSEEGLICTETAMVDDEKNSDMPKSKKVTKSEEEDIEKMTTMPEPKKSNCTEDSVGTEMTDTEKNSGTSESKKTREATEDGSAENLVCTEAAMMDDEKNSDMPENRKESTTETKSDKDEVKAVAAVPRQEGEIKVANDMYRQGMQCENDMNFCEAINFYKQAAELGSKEAVYKLARFHLYYDEDCIKIINECRLYVLELIKQYNKLQIVCSRLEEIKRLNPESVKGGYTPDGNWDPNFDYDVDLEWTSDWDEDSDYDWFPYDDEMYSNTSNPWKLHFKRKLAYAKKRCIHHIDKFNSRLEQNCCQMDKFDKNLSELYKNATKLIHMYFDALRNNNSQQMHERLVAFNEYCDIIKNEDPEKVFKWYEIAAETGNADILYNLAEYYERGHGFKYVDYQLMNSWYYRTFVEDRQLYIYSIEIKYEANNRNASEVYKKMAELINKYEKTEDQKEKSDLVSQISDYIIMSEKEYYLKTHEFHKKMANVAKLYEKAAEGGNTKAMCKLAFYYTYGIGGVPQDLNKAIELYQRAADLGNSDAMCRLAFCYISGEKLTRDLDKAEQLLQQAEKKENIVAIRTLARFWELGIRRPQDFDKGRALEKKALDLHRAKIEGLEYFEIIQKKIPRLNPNYSDKTFYWAPCRYYQHSPQRKEEAENGRLDAIRCLIHRGIEPEKWAKEAANLGYFEAYNELSRFYSRIGNHSLSEKWHEMYLEEKKKWIKFHSKRDNLSILMSDVEKFYLENEFQKGNTYAMYELAHLYELGHFYEVDRTYEGGKLIKEKIYKYANVNRAYMLYEQAANWGNLDAMVKVGVCYRDGKGVCKNATIAKMWLEHSAKSGSVEGMYEYGVFFEEVDFKTGEAIKWYEKVAAVAEVDKNRYAEVMRRLGICYKVKFTRNEGLRNSINYLNRAYELGDIEAMRQLGICYENGEGVDKNLSMAAKLYQLATDRNNAKAMVNLASCYENGHGVPQDLNIAIELLQQAVDLNDSDAMFNLASWYEQGKGGLPQDLVEVACLLGQAAGNGHVEAMYKLGIMFMNGEGVVQNLELGISWLQRAADEDNIEALRALASCYEKGHGVPQNDEIVIGLLQKIDTLSEIDEICKSAYRYEYGVGVAQDLNIATCLYIVATTKCPIVKSTMAEVLNRDLNRCYNKAVDKGISLYGDVLEFMDTYEQYLLD